MMFTEHLTLVVATSDGTYILNWLDQIYVFTNYDLIASFPFSLALISSL